jgi:hypothetical protein
MRFKHFRIIPSILFFLLSVPLLFAADLTSTSFIVRDPAIGTGGNYQTSSSFKLFTSGSLNTQGPSSATSFIGRFGFLYYPYGTSGVLSANVSGSTIQTSWTASTAGLGYDVAGYKIGIASVSGGPYTFTTLGVVTSYNYTNQVAGTYYLVLQTINSDGTVIATSNEVSATITPGLSFGVSSSQLQFGTLSSATVRYATTSGGSGSNSVAHTIDASSNAPSGYTLTYYGPSLSSNGNTITPATISGSPTAGQSQFALSVSTSGSASIPSAYQQSSSNWKFVANTTSTIASTSGPTSSETYSIRYVANVTSTTPGGQYATNLTYILTGNY